MKVAQVLCQIIPLKYLFFINSRFLKKSIANLKDTFLENFEELYFRRFFSRKHATIFVSYLGYGIIHRP